MWHCCQKRGCPRQVLPELCGGGWNLLEQLLAKRGAIARGSVHIFVCTTCLQRIVCLCEKAARASVASTVSELVDVLPKLASCRRQESLLQNSMGTEGALELRGRIRSQADVQSSASQITKDVDAPNGIQASAVLSLMKEARQAVITARAMLF